MDENKNKLLHNNYSEQSKRRKVDSPDTRTIIAPHILQQYYKMEERMISIYTIIIYILGQHHYQLMYSRCYS